MIYFVCASPGSSGNFVSRLLKSLTNIEIIDFVQITYSQPTPETLTRDFFFDNIVVPEDTNAIVSVPFRPDFDKLNERFPGCKIIVITHLLQECTDIARAYFKSYYASDYNVSSEPFFRKMINEHAHLFSNINCTPDDLSIKEIEICVKILAYQKLLDGFHSLVVPETQDALEIKFHDLFFNTVLVEQRLEQFTGNTFTTQEKELSKELVTEFIQRYLNFTRSPFSF